jgi:hypothetical protein
VFNCPQVITACDFLRETSFFSISWVPESTAALVAPLILQAPPCLPFQAHLSHLESSYLVHKTQLKCTSLVKPFLALELYREELSSLNFVAFSYHVSWLFVCLPLGCLESMEHGTSLHLLSVCWMNEWDSTMI